MALVTALMAMLMMLALGAGVALTTATETAIAANHRDGIQALYAAEAGVDLAVTRLRTEEEWSAVMKAGGPTLLLQAPLADLLQTGAVDARIGVAVTASPNPGGDENVLVLQSSAGIPGGIRRNIEVIVKRRPATGEIDILSWR